MDSFTFFTFTTASGPREQRCLVGYPLWAFQCQQTDTWGKQFVVHPVRSVPGLYLCSIAAAFLQRGESFGLDAPTL
jgi:hypothetical protein